MKENLQESGFFSLVQARRSVRVFNQTEPFDFSAVGRSIEAAVLAPNSSNMQLWEFHRVKETSPLKDKLAKLCIGQKAATTARELVLVVARRDLWKKRAAANYAYIDDCYKDSDPVKRKRGLSYYSNLVPKLYAWYPFWSPLKQIAAWAIGLKRPMVREVSEADVRVSVHKSAALAAMTFMYAMKAEGYDTCPMEGFDSKRVKKLLGLPKSAEINMIIGCGKSAPDGVYGPRFRVPMEDVVVEY